MEKFRPRTAVEDFAHIAGLVQFPKYQSRNIPELKLEKGRKTKAILQIHASVHVQRTMYKVLLRTRQLYSYCSQKLKPHAQPLIGSVTTSSRISSPSGTQSGVLFKRNSIAIRLMLAVVLLLPGRKTLLCRRMGLRCGTKRISQTLGRQAVGRT